ncbi:MAG: hypothetical protein LBI28_00955 [Treponema sp.]|nr:hypothetical protein [Treponema sp.]
MSKKAIIITDGTEVINQVSDKISDALTGFNVKICPAEEFVGNELLPADVFFIGCEKSSPASFDYLEDFLSHINLASRKCGVFSVEEKVNKYLLSLLRDSEADAGAPLLAENGKTEDKAVKKWIKSIT